MSTQLNFDSEDTELFIPSEADSSKKNTECCNCQCMSILFVSVMFLVCGGGFAALFYSIVITLLN